MDCAGACRAARTALAPFRSRHEEFEWSRPYERIERNIQRGLRRDIQMIAVLECRRLAGMEIQLVQRHRGDRGLQLQASAVARGPRHAAPAVSAEGNGVAAEFVVQD